jgi:hypothetical protein
MAENRTTTSNGADRGTENAAEGARASAVQVMGDAQEKLRVGASQVAERLPEAVATAQVAARDTQQALTQMPDQTLLAGASFSLGLAIGLFFAGVNRLLVVAALAPAAAMAATLFGRNSDGAAGDQAATGGNRRRATTNG